MTSRGALAPQAFADTGDWASQGACREVDPETLFVTGAAQHKAKVICAGCTVRVECLADALDRRIEFGVWGGLTERERRSLLRQLPAVPSWRDYLTAWIRRTEATLSTGTDGD